MDRSVSSSVEEGPVYTHQTMRLEEGMALECGAHLAPLEVAYCTYGTLSATRDNAILVCHALTGTSILQSLTR